MKRTYTLNVELANKTCELLKNLPYFEVADVLAEFIHQDEEYDKQEAAEKAAKEAQPELPLES